MKKIVLATLLLALVGSSYAQKTTAKTPKAITKQGAVTNPEKKPTKIETMDWIAGKMKENLGLGREFISYADGKFTYKKQWKAFVYCNTTIDLSKVVGMNSEYSQDFFISGKNIGSTICDESYGNNTFEYISISGPNYKDYSAPFSFGADKSMVDRLKKAFTTLIEYNSPKKAEGESF